MLCNLVEDVFDQVVSEKNDVVLVVLLLVVFLLLGFIHFAHVLLVCLWSEQEAKQCISNVCNLEYFTGILVTALGFVLGNLVANSFI